MRTRFWIPVVAAITLGCVVARATPVSTWQTLPPQRPLPSLTNQGRLEHAGASIWYAVLGTGSPVILLHGGLASSNIWGNQIPALLKTHHQIILIDSRGHGRSTPGAQPADAVNPSAFSSPILTDLAPRLSKDYSRLSPTPAGFDALNSAVEAMQKTQPNYSTAELAAIRGPRIVIVDGDHEEFITRAHTEYLARTIPGATLILLRGVSHFAPWQAPGQFDRSMLSFLDTNTAAASAVE